MRILTATSTKYLVDKRGRKKAIVLDIKEYSQIINRLDELEDALDLDEAVRSAGKFREYSKIREELHHAGRL